MQIKRRRKVGVAKTLFTDYFDTAWDAEPAAGATAGSLTAGRLPEAGAGAATNAAADAGAGNIGAIGVANAGFAGGLGPSLIGASICGFFTRSGDKLVTLFSLHAPARDVVFLRR
jgi:hypothetical protein